METYLAAWRLSSHLTVTLMIVFLTEWHDVEGVEMIDASCLRWRCWKDLCLEWTMILNSNLNLFITWIIILLL